MGGVGAGSLLHPLNCCFFTLGEGEVFCLCGSERAAEEACPLGWITVDWRRGTEPFRCSRWA